MGDSGRKSDINTEEVINVLAPVFVYFVILSGVSVTIILLICNFALFIFHFITA